MTVLRRLDCVLAPYKLKVLDYLPKVEKLSDSAKDLTLNKIAGANFHNRSQFDFSRLLLIQSHCRQFAQLYQWLFRFRP